MGAHPPVQWRGLLALCLLLLSPGSSQDVKVENGLEGGTIQLKPTFEGVVEGFTWKKGENKIVEVDFPHPPTYYSPEKKNSLNNKTGVLDIRDLTIQDDGLYKAEVLIDSKYTYSNFELHVFPALPQPRVECNITNGNVTARCHLDGEYLKPFSYTWGILDTKQEYSFSEDNKTLTVINAMRDSTDRLTCVVKNPATQNSSSVLLKTCFPEDGNRNRVVSIGTLFAAILTVALIVACICKKGQNRAGQHELNDGQNRAGQQHTNDDNYSHVSTEETDHRNK